MVRGKSQGTPASSAQDTMAKPEPQQAPKPAAPRFVPMSVGKGKKKKPIAARPTPTPTEAPSTSGLVEPPPQPVVESKPRKPKVSLFGVYDDAEPAVKGPPTTEYQPLLYGVEKDENATVPDAAVDQLSANQYTAPSARAPSSSGLTNIASELNLSEAERRQLFGKKGRNAPDFSGAKIVEFNTDEEYAHNERLRQQGEAVAHNPLKSISGTGKNSLRSLVNVATTQKDALEDHFAASHRNKREAGNRYGW